MFNNIKIRFPYAHTKHFFLKLVAKKYGNQCCTLPRRVWGIMYTKTNPIKFCVAAVITAEKLIVNDVECWCFDGN